MTDLISYAVADGVAHIELNRPDAANAIDMPTAQAFRAAIGRAAADDTVRAVLLTGAGKRFCAGGDVAAFASFESAEDQRDYLVGLAHELDAANPERTEGQTVELQ